MSEGGMISHHVCFIVYSDSFWNVFLNTTNLFSRLNTNIVFASFTDDSALFVLFEDDKL